MATDSLASDAPSKRGSMWFDRNDLAHGLCELDHMEFSKQTAFWKSCVEGKQVELKLLGGLPIDSVYNDVLTRYFDSSSRGMKRVYDSAVRDQQDPSIGKLDKEGLYDALSEHYNFFENLRANQTESTRTPIVLEDGAHEQFDRICGVVGLPCDLDSFSYAVRRLRIAVLLDHFDMRKHGDHRDGQIFHFDYDDDDIWTPFNGSRDTRKVSYGGKVFDIPVVAHQVPLSSFDQYLFTSKTKRQGRVHWTHLHCPSTELILAVGQVWRFTGPDLALMCDLKKAQPQISIHGDTSQVGHEDKYGYSWSSLVMPGVYLDRTSRESMELFQEWFALRQDPVLRNTVSPDPPRIRVGVTHTTLCMLWTSMETNSAVTACSAPYYIGKWVTDSEDAKQGFFSKLLDMITCVGCSRRQGDQVEEIHDEESPLLSDRKKLRGLKGDHTESGVSISDELNALLTGGEMEHSMIGEKATDRNESCVSFERTFEKILVTLERQNSMLRLGNHYQLLMRIIANRTLEYLDVLEVYQAAIARLSYLLREKSTPNKDALVKKIELLKLELNTLHNIVKPYSDYVVPDICKVAESLHSEHPMAYSHAKDIQNNIRLFVPKADALIDSCTNLTNEYDRNASDKMNNILNILTFITFVITPTQLMTGVYGMNFKVMPELQWDRGYSHFFWGLATSLTLIFALTLICLKRG